MKTEVNQFLWFRRFASELLRRWRKLVGLLKKKRKNEKNKKKKTLHPGLFSRPNGKSCSCHFLLPLNHFFFGRSYPSYEYTKEKFAHEGPLSRLVPTTHPSNPFNKVDKWSSRPKKLCKRADHSKFIFVN